MDGLTHCGTLDNAIYCTVLYDYLKGLQGFLLLLQSNFQS